MGKNKIQSKTKAVITLSCVALFFVVMIGVIAVGWLKKKEVAEEVWSSTMTVTSLDELKSALAADAEIEITFSGDVVVREALKVNGKKHLCGDGSIAMALDAEANQRILHVANDSELIFDGVTIDGNSIANGIYVAEKAKLTFLSGQVIYAQACGLEVDGEVAIKGGKITETIHSAVFVGSGGTVDITGGEIVWNVHYGVNVAAGGYAKISEDAVIQHTDGTLVRVAGACDVIGVELKDAGVYLVNAYGGTVNISQKEGVTEKLEFSDAGKWGLQVGVDGQLTAENVYLHDTGRRGVHVSVGAGAFSMENCKIENITEYGIRLNKVWDKAVLKNVEITNVENYYGIRNDVNSVVEMENITLSNIKARAILNDGGYITAKNIVVENAAQWGVTTNGNGNSVGEFNIDGLVINGTNERNAINCAGSVMIVKNATLNDAKQNAVRVHQEGKMNLTNITINRPTRYGMLAEGGGSITFNNVKIYNAGSRGIASMSGTITGTDTYIDTTKTEHGITSSGNGKVTITGVTMKNIGIEAEAANGFNVAQGSEMKITDATVTNVKSIGARCTSGTLSLTNVEFSDLGERGVMNYAGKITANKLVVKNAGIYGVTSAGSKEVAGSVTMTNVTIDGVGTKSAINCSGSYMEAKNVSISGVKTLHGARVSAGGTIVLDDVTIDSPGQAGIYSAENSNVTANKIVVTNAGTRGMHISGGVAKVTDIQIDTTKTEHGIGCSAAADVEINNLTITNVPAEYNGINVVDGSKVTVNNGSIDGKGTMEYGTRVARNGNITLNNVEIKNAAYTAVYVDDATSGTNLIDVTLKNIGNHGIKCVAGTVKATGLDIETSKQYAVYASEGGKIEVNDAEINGTFERGIFATNSGSSITGDAVTITAPTIHGIAASDSGAVTLGNVTITDVQEGNGINAVTNSQVTINGVSRISNIHYVEGSSSVGYGARAATGAALTLNNVTIEKTDTRSLIYVADETTKVNLSNVILKDSGEDGIRCNTGTVEADGLTLTDIKGYGVQVFPGGSVKNVNVTVNGTTKRGLAAVGGTITGSDITVTSPTQHGVTASVSGVVELSNVTITDVQEGNGINAVSNSTVTIKGGTIDGAEVYGARVDGGATLTLEDVNISKAGTNALIVGESSTLNLKGDSVIDGGDADLRGVDVSGTFNMYGGTIKNFKKTVEKGTKDGTDPGTNDGAAVLVRTGAVFNLKGGILTNNSGYYGGAVYVNGTFTMDGGEISENLALQGGAIWTETDVVMNGGKINANEATSQGGAIKLYTGAGFTMNDGEIKDNHTPGGYGGAIHAHGSNEINLLKGTMSGNTSAGGDKYGKTNAIQASSCANKTQIVIGEDFVMGVNSIRLSTVTSTAVPVVKIIGNPLSAEYPLYIAMSNSLQKKIAIECDSYEAALAILENLKSADEKAEFYVSGNKILAKKK